MSYRSLLTVFNEPDDFDPALAVAIDLARKHDAHLDVVCLGLDSARYSVGYADVNAAVIVAAMNEVTARTAEMAARARARLEHEDIRWAVEDAGAQIMGPGAGISARARYADLVILPRPLGQDRGVGAEEVMEAALFGGHAPVLVVPPEGLKDWPPQNIVVAWDGSDEAMAAVRAARPLLAAAATVSVAVVDPGRLHHEGGDPGGALARYLVRHGVTAEVSVLARTSGKVADVLNQHVRDRDAKLLVMGAYGHARLRELILGGTTRDMLRDSAAPLLLAR